MIRTDRPELKPNEPVEVAGKQFFKSEEDRFCGVENLVQGGPDDQFRSDDSLLERYLEGYVAPHFHLLLWDIRRNVDLGDYCIVIKRSCRNLKSGQLGWPMKISASLGMVWVIVSNLCLSLASRSCSNQRGSIIGCSRLYGCNWRNSASASGWIRLSFRSILPLNALRQRKIGKRVSGSPISLPANRHAR